MIFDTLPAIYAQALLDLTEKDYDSVEHEFSDVVRLMASDPKVELFFRSPLIRSETKVRIIERTFRGKASATMVNFLCVLARRNRLSEIGKVYDIYRYYVSEKLGKKSVVVITAIVPDAAMKSGIDKALQKYFESKLDVQYEVRPELLGGVVIRHEGREIDVSVLKGIRLIRQRLMARQFFGEKFYEN